MDILLTRTPIVWVALANLVVAGVTWIGLVFSAGLGRAEQLRKQVLFDPVVIELGLTILGPVGAVFFLLWMATDGYAMLIPGALCGVTGAAIFFRAGVRRDRFGIVEVAFSLGALIVSCTFILGANDISSRVGGSLELIGIEHGPLARGVVWLAVVSMSVVMFKLWVRNVRRHDSKHTKRMQNEAAYRRLFEEKSQIEGRLKNVHEREERYENESKISRIRGTE